MIHVRLALSSSSKSEVYKIAITLNFILLGFLKARLYYCVSVGVRACARARVTLSCVFTISTGT